jgi:hypothetical protein
MSISNPLISSSGDATFRDTRTRKAAFRDSNNIAVVVVMKRLFGGDQHVPRRDRQLSADATTSDLFSRSFLTATSHWKMRQDNQNFFVDR